MTEEFRLIFPAWVLVSKDSVRRDDDGVAIGVVDRPGFHSLRDGDKIRLVILTDSDLADRYVQGNKTHQLVKSPCHNAMDLVKLLLVFAQAGGTSIILDPLPAGTTYSIETVINCILREAEK